MMDNFKTIPGITLVGLFLAFLAVPLLIYIAGRMAPVPYSDAFVIGKELLIFGVAGLLLLVVVKGEKKSLVSIGLHNRHWGRSIITAIVTTVVCFGGLIMLIWLLGLLEIPVGGNEAGRYEALSLWTMSLVVLRAGIVEEICYRGYIMERLEKYSGNWYVYFLFPLVIFSLAHYSQGFAGLTISFLLGGILAWVYWKKRDLKANIMAHFLVDFIPNVLIPWISPEQIQ